KIVDQLHACSFSDPEIFFSLGVLEMRLSLLGFAEDSFNQCLSLSPHYEDAEIGLADLYVIERKYKEAEAIYQEFPERNEALSGLALIAERTGNFSLAETLYRKALENTPKDWELRERLARVLTNKLQYDKAKEEYAILLEENPSERLWIRSMNVKSHTNVALLEEINYTNAKENDPTLGVPVVKDYYFLSRFTLLVPVVNKWRLDAQQIYFYQRENNIYAPSVNYSASINGGAMLSHFYFAKDWKWDVILKGIQATGIQNANFPFQKGALFEPGTVLTYNGDWHFFALDAHVEEQIIKNFAYTISQMLRIDVYNGGYGIHPPVAFHPNGEFSVGQNFYHDSIHNWKQYQKIRVDSDLFVSPIRVTYLFEHSRFKKLSPDYFTYLKQIQNTLSFRFLHDFGAGVQLEATWDYFLQSNTDVILPIGTFIFIAPSLYLIGNRATGLLRYRFQDHLRFEISGHYLHVSTLPYRDWNLKGSLFWQF
ncbi:MAG: tetratricopeptide repeat protein, partial [Chlamydiae bacterium]|nr:tetratricopeptide repeat protein [Chlamydiota bacterium]